MSGVVYIFFAPVLLLITIPLTTFAAFTTAIAFSTLFFRALVVYAELAAALIEDQVASHTPRHRTTPFDTATEEKPGRRKSRRSSAGSGSSISCTTPKASKNGGLGIYSGEGITRDFEGVGGWRVPGPEGEDELWISMNSRLELPVMVGGNHRNHHRSRTSGNFTTYQITSKSSPHSRARSPHDRRASTEGAFANRISSKSTTALDMANVGKALLRHQPSSSSASSQGSNRTLHLTLSKT